MIGVAISTTGDEHRLGFLETSVDHWRMALTDDEPLFVTVDGTQQHMRVVEDRLRHYDVTVLRVGQPLTEEAPFRGRCGVAANKNTGIEALMDAGVIDLFLCDDDTWPRSRESVEDHLRCPLPHSMVCWGLHRRPHRTPEYVAWAWPRGVLLYVEREVVEEVGGMIEEFGQGGHEHVEFSRRIHQAGITRVPFGSPLSNYDRRALGAHRLWHAEDMPGPNEGMGSLRVRRQRITTVKVEDHNWPHIQQMMKDKNNDISFVPFRAEENGRAAATMSSHNT